MYGQTWFPSEASAGNTAEQMREEYIGLQNHRFYHLVKPMNHCIVLSYEERYGGTAIHSSGYVRFSTQLSSGKTMSIICPKSYTEQLTPTNWGGLMQLEYTPYFTVISMYVRDSTELMKNITMLRKKYHESSKRSYFIGYCSRDSIERNMYFDEFYDGDDNEYSYATSTMEADVNIYTMDSHLGFHVMSLNHKPLQNKWNVKFKTTPISFYVHPRNQ
jgi:hypothetical protein